MAPSSDPTQAMNEMLAGLQGTIASLNTTVETLNGRIASLEKVLQQREMLLQQRESEVAELKRMLFGASSERYRMPTVDEERKKNRKAKAKEDEKSTPPKNRGGRKPATTRPELPTEELVHELESCPDCEDTHLTATGRVERSEEIEFIPAHFIRRVHLRPYKRCLGCARVACAPPAPRVGDCSAYGPGLHAHAVVAKCADAMPLNRLSESFARQGIHISRSTLTDLFHRTAETLRPIWERLLAKVAESAHVNADETPIPVQAPGKCRKGFMWTFLTSQIITYVYANTRSGEIPKQVLGESSGVLQVDAYAGYNTVCVSDGRTRAGCWAHVRRKFFEAHLDGDKDATRVISLILELYETEYLAAQDGVAGTAKHLALRKHHSAPTLSRLDALLTDLKATVPPKSPMGKAISYARGNWASLRVFLDDAEVRLDNNLAENALRIVALGRKNFLFAGSDRAGENIAVLQTIVATCKVNQINPWEYISDLLIRLPDTKAKEVDSMLPMNWKAQGPSG